MRQHGRSASGRGCVFDARRWYCWWPKSGDHHRKDVWKPIHNGINYLVSRISEPSTVWIISTEWLRRWVKTTLLVDWIEQLIPKARSDTWRKRLWWISSGFWTDKVSYSPGGVYNGTVGVTPVLRDHHLNCFVWFLTFTSIRDLKQRFQLHRFFSSFSSNLCFHEPQHSNILLIW